MSFLKRLFSSSYRRALEAEARGDHDAAARAYALAGEHDKVCEMNLLKAEAATTRKEEIEGLRAAVRWAAAESAVGKRARRRLGDALAAEARGAGMAGEHDRAAMKEAAEVYTEAAAHAEAAACWEALGDDAAASRAWGAAGQIEKMETALARDEQRDRRERRLREAFDEYQMQLAAGDRELARSALRMCVEVAESKGDYRRLLEELETRRIASGLVRLWITTPGSGAARLPLTVCGASPVRIGRDPAAELPLRGGGVSRWHAEVAWAEGQWLLTDAGSKNGTRIAGARLEGAVPMASDGRFEVGDDSEVGYHEAAGVLRLEVVRGMDRGRVVMAAVGRAIDVQNTPAKLSFREGRPYLEIERAAVRLNGARTASTVQLLRGDVVEAGEVRIEVEK